VGIDQAVSQVRALLMAGFQVRLVFSSMAEHLFGDLVCDQLAGFPQWSVLPPVSWLASLRTARAVVVPMLSVNSLSKLAQLVADSQTSNLLLHGLFTGKPVVLARNGVEDGPGRHELGFDRANGALRQAVAERLALAAGFGCILSDLEQLASVVSGLVPEGGEAAPPSQVAVAPVAPVARPVQDHHGQVVTAGDVMAAHGAGADLRCRALITPLARDAAARLGVRLLGDDVAHNTGR
jgi:hypothetical protein